MDLHAKFQPLPVIHSIGTNGISLPRGLNLSSTVSFLKVLITMGMGPFNNGMLIGLVYITCCL